jgi:hypothetical protein
MPTGATAIFQKLVAADRRRRREPFQTTAVGYRAATAMAALPPQFLILPVASWQRRHEGEASSTYAPRIACWLPALAPSACD